MSDAWRALALVLVNLSLLPSLPVVGLSFSFLSALSRSVYASAPAETGFGSNTSRATDRSESLSPTNGSAPIFPTAISAICAWTRSTGYGMDPNHKLAMGLPQKPALNLVKLHLPMTQP